MPLDFDFKVREIEFIMTNVEKSMNRNEELLNARDVFDAGQLYPHQKCIRVVHMKI